MKFSWLKNWRLHWPLLLVVLISLYICFVNYKPGTWLSGWDTLQPEFNLGLYAHRVFFGAWQEHQGLGAPASQAHLAELPRLPILWLLQSVLPDNLVRYCFFFLMYILGGIGTYVFIRFTWFKRHQTLNYSWAAAIGSLFYLLNLGTLQHFYVPLEMFAVHFATIGFVLWSIHRYITQPNRHNLLLYFIIQIFTAPSAHTSTLFYAYMVIVGLYALLLTLFTHHQKFRSVVSVLLFLAVTTFTAHSYWIVPNLYYVTQHSQYVSEAKISRNFSAEAFWQNQAYGSLDNVIIFRNFLFNWKDFDFSTHSFVDLFDEWRDRLDAGLGYLIFYLLAICSLLGLGISLKHADKAVSFSVLALFAASLFFLVNLNFPFTPLFTIILQSELLKEALRFPFTKFSIVFILVMSVYLAHLISFLLEFFQEQPKAKDRKLFSGGLIVVAFAAILLANRPALSGNLISDHMKVTFPNEYQALFEYMKSQPAEGRIMKLPLTTYWGWVYQDWPMISGVNGYQGAGFTWFGLPQSTMDREFDRWANTNEFFYQEINLAFKERDVLKITKIFDKFDIDYLLLDTSNLNVEVRDQQADAVKAEEMIATLGLQPEWRDGYLSLYKLRDTNGYVFAPDSYQSLVTDISSQRIDLAYNTQGDYLIAKDQSNLLFPFGDLLSDKVKNVTYTDRGFEIYKQFTTPTAASALVSSPTRFLTVPVELSYQNRTLLLAFPYSYGIESNGQFFNLPTLNAAEVITGSELQNLILQVGENQLSIKPGQTITSAVTFDTSQPIEAFYFDSGNIFTEGEDLIVPDSQTFSFPLTQPIPELFNYQQAIMVGDPFRNVKFSAVSQAIPVVIAQSPAYNCENKGLGKVVKTNHPDSSVTYESDQYGISCDSAPFSLLNKQSYLLHIKGQNNQGRSLKIAIRDQINNQVVLEELLPEGDYDETYSFSTPEANNFEFILGWETRSFGQKASNTIEKIELYPLPSEFLAGLHFTTADVMPASNMVQLSNVERSASYLYSLTAEGQSTENLIVLSQTYDPLWVAFNPNRPFSLFPHAEFNGWANGWILPPGKQAVILIYLPQLAAFGGYGLVLLTFAWLLWPRKPIIPTTRKTTIKRVLIGQYPYHS